MADTLAILARLGATFERTASVRDKGDLQEVLQDVARAIGEVLGYRAVVVNVYRPAFDDMLTAAAVGSEESVQQLVGTSSPNDTWTPLFAPRFERGGAYFIPDGEFDWDLLGANTYVPQLPESALVVAGDPARKVGVGKRRKHFAGLGKAPVDRLDQIVDRMREAVELGVRERLALVINRANSGVAVADIERTVGMPSIALIRSGGLLFVRAANEGRTVIEMFPKERITDDFDALADRVLGTPIAPPPVKVPFGLFNRAKTTVRA